ncbi:MAG: hemin uptake protein HemP [Planctomycetaceae bacterium]|nr:hemin uptake protein HemP [Planctomycetaceae bacterium]
MADKETANERLKASEGPAAQGRATQGRAAQSPAAPGPAAGGAAIGADAGNGTPLFGPTDTENLSGHHAASALPKIISFSSLVRCGDEVWIEHGGSLYRLRRTKQDKLILTK